MSVQAALRAISMADEKVVAASEDADPWQRIDRVTPSDAAAFSRHCGYATEQK
jgi:hypothetical protein